MRMCGKLIGAAFFCSAPALIAGVVLQPAPAPEWEISAWLNDDPGSLHDLRGQVVVIAFVQRECPASKEFAIPLLQRWRGLSGDREDLAAVFILSESAADAERPLERLYRFIRDNGIVLPVGIDAYDGESKAVHVTMRRFEAGGTPQFVVVDRDGFVRFTHFGIFDPRPVERFIERLLEEPRGTMVRWSGAAPRTMRVRSAVDARLSGNYVFRTERATGACADWIPGMEVLGELRIHRDAIDIDFVEPLIGIAALEAPYDATTGRVQGESIVATAPQGAGVAGGVVRFDGTLDTDSRPPELVFELLILDGSCTVAGRARGKP